MLSAYGLTLGTFDFHYFSHWMGLSHVYTGGCEQGDRVSDTPASGLPNFGCNPAENRDTCPLEQGLDPIFNFMDAR